MIGLHARVEFNADGSLCTIPALLKHEFGISNRTQAGLCLVSQVAFTIEALTGLNANSIAHHILQGKSLRNRVNGFTLEEILNTFTRPVYIRGVYYRISTLVDRHENIGSVVDYVCRGYPVMLIIGRDAVARIENEAHAYEDGTSTATVIRACEDGQYHTYLAFGADTAGYIIVREARHQYGFKGYLRLSAEVLNDCFKNIGAISVHVTSASIVTP